MTQKPKRRPKVAPYHWFKGASVRQLYDQLTAVGPDVARVEVRVSGEKMTFQVVRPPASTLEVAVADALPSINDSFICPPIC